MVASSTLKNGIAREELVFLAMKLCTQRSVLVLGWVLLNCLPLIKCISSTSTNTLHSVFLAEGLTTHPVTATLTESHNFPNPQEQPPTSTFPDFGRSFFSYENRLCKDQYAILAEYYSQERPEIRPALVLRLFVSTPLPNLHNFLISTLLFSV